MNRLLICTASGSPALDYAASALRRNGIAVTGQPVETVTHLLLPVPAFTPDGNVKGHTNTAELLRRTPPGIPACGGALTSLQESGRPCLDLLQDPMYLAQNAAITARCALRLAAAHLPAVTAGLPVLVLGWGRIGKALSLLLRSLGAEVTVFARKETDRAMASGLGLHTADLSAVRRILPAVRLLYNTVPAAVLSGADLSRCPNDCIKIELASLPGLDGSDVLDGRGLPGRMAPESSGILIARTAIRLIHQKEERL